MTTSSHSRPPLTRGEARPVRRRTRTFRPNYLSFAGTYQCNLSCPHCCVPIEWTDRLDIEVALRFLEDAHAQGIGILGLTGGEPFLYPEFLHSVCHRAAQLGFRFDKIMTNGVWYRDAAHLEAVLRPLAEAGFTGKLGLSVDKFHGIQTARLAEFCRLARRIFDRDTILSLSYASRNRLQGLEPVQALAAALDAVVEWSDVLGRYLLVSSDLTMTLNWNHLAPVERAERFSGAWDGTWFEEDYCEGPGQALIVNPRGEVKPCCGFASDLDELTIGNIYTDTAAQVIRRGRRHPYVGKVFREGLTAIREEILARDPNALPAATSNHCYFCWYVLKKGIWQGPQEAAPAGNQRLISLPLVELEPETVQTTLEMVFDGVKVLLGKELPARGEGERGEVMRVTITGPAPVAVPASPLTWEQYQAWVDQLWAAGYHSSSARKHHFGSKPQLADC